MGIGTMENGDGDIREWKMGMRDGGTGHVYGVNRKFFKTCKLWF